MHNESINTIDLINARGKEISAIEDSISRTSKKTMLFQRLPHYLRRRSRSPEHKSRKYNHRRKARHFMRSHTFYAKRFFMLKLSYCSIPYSMHLKSDKFIYKSMNKRGFFIEETFRGIAMYERTEKRIVVEGGPGNLLDGELEARINREIRSGSLGLIAYSSHVEIIIDRTKVFLVGLLSSTISPTMASISILVTESWNIPLPPLATVYPHVSSPDNRYPSLETHKIICPSTSVMDVFQRLRTNGFIPVGLKEIERIATEKCAITPYDLVNTPLFKEIDTAITAEVSDKYTRTPPGKRESYDTAKLPIYTSGHAKYFVCMQRKGCCTRGALIFKTEECIGRLIRASFCYSKGCVTGLAYLTKEIDSLEGLSVKSLQNNQSYDLYRCEYL